MKYYLLTILFLVGMSAVSAAEDILSACSQAFQIEQYRAQCVQALSQRQAVTEQGTAQIEAARQQALGLAAFRSGQALIGGMNQSVQAMQVHPYVLPPVHPIRTR